MARHATLLPPISQDPERASYYPLDGTVDSTLNVPTVTSSTGNQRLDSLHASLRQVDRYNELFNHSSRRGWTSRTDTTASRLSGVVIRLPEADKTSLEAYHAELEARASEVPFLKSELLELIKANDKYKLTQLCCVIKKSGYNLSDDEWLGDGYGEPVLAIAVANNCNEAVKVLIEFAGSDLICKRYSTPNHGSITSLHLAIIRKNAEIVSCLLEALPDDKKKVLLGCPCSAKREEADSCMPPLAMAVRVGNFDVINSLLEHDAELMGRDPVSGNNILHCLAEIGVKSPSKAVDILSGLLHGEATQSWWERNRDMDKDENFTEVLLKMKNAAGYTPMRYAMLIHSTEYAAAILNTINVYTLPNWDVNPEHENWFEVSEIDPAVSDTGAFSVLEMYTYSMSNRVLTLGEMPQLKKVIENKWKRYKKLFVAWFLIHLAVMTSFTLYTNLGRVHPAILAYQHRPDYEQTGVDGNNSTTAMITNIRATGSDHFFLILELFVLFVAIVYLVADIVDATRIVLRHFRCRARPGECLKYHLLVVIHHFDLNCVMLSLFSVSVPILFALRLVGSPWSSVFHALAAVNGWSFMMFYVRAMKDAGIFTAIVYRMILRELASVTILIVIVVLAYGTGFHALFHDANPRLVPGLWDTYFRLVEVTVGLEGYAALDETRMPWFAKLVFISFLLLCQILLLNVLIAAMNNTYNELSTIKHVIRMHVLCGTILVMERRIPKCLRPEHGLVQLEGEDDNYWFLGSDVTERDKPWKGI